MINRTDYFLLKVIELGFAVEKKVQRNGKEYFKVWDDSPIAGFLIYPDKDTVVKYVSNKKGKYDLSPIKESEFSNIIHTVV